MSSSISVSDTERAAVGRLWRALAVVLIVTCVAIFAFVGIAREEIVAAGQRELSPLHLFDRMLSAEGEEGLPRVLFLGDSTFRRSYPLLVARQLDGQIDARIHWADGLGPYHHYAVLGGAIGLEPEAVVLIAHLRVMLLGPPLRDPALLMEIPLRELPRTAALPFHAQGIGIGRIVLGSFAGSLLPLSALDLAAGAIDVARRTGGLRWLVPARWPDPSPGRMMTIRGGRYARYATPIEPGDPVLDVLGASVELATRHGARTLVIVSPIPVEELRVSGLYEDALFARRIGFLRDVVESNGGELFDLHDMLGPQYFSDDLGHTERTGSRLIADRVVRWVREALDLPTRRAGGVPTDPPRRARRP